MRSIEAEAGGVLVPMPGPAALVVIEAVTLLVVVLPPWPGPGA